MTYGEMMRRSDPSPVPRRAGEDAVAGHAFNEALLDSLNRSGDLYLTHTKLNDRYVIRSASARPTPNFVTWNEPGNGFARKPRG